MIRKTVSSILVFLFVFLFKYHALAASGDHNKLIGVDYKVEKTGVAVDLRFKKNIASKSVETVFDRNFVQLVLANTQIDKAKIIPIEKHDVQKIFAYAYNPDVTRVRVIFTKNSSSFKNRVSLVNLSSKLLRVFVKSSVVVETSDKRKESSFSEKFDERAISKENNPKEQEIIKEVISKTPDIDIRNPEEVKAAMASRNRGITEDVAVNSLEPSGESSKNIGTKADPSKSFIRMGLVLFGIIALFLLGVFLLKKYSSKLKKLPFGKRERLIQVIATHYLGHKKSISLVKVTGEYMVVGVSNDGISLITKLGSEVNVEKYLEDRFWGGTFEKHLKSYDGAKDLVDELKTESTVPTEPVVSQKEPKSSVKKSIREKLTKLKPLV